MSALEIVQLLGAIGEFVGAIAVVATLVFLAVQIRASASAAQAAAIEAGRTRRISSFEAQRDSPYLPVIQAKLARGGEMDDVERLRIANHCAALWGLLYAEWVQRDLGTQGEYATHAAMGLAQAIGFRPALEWWRGAGVRLYPDRFVAYVEAQIREMDIDEANAALQRAGFTPEV